MPSLVKRNGQLFEEETSLADRVKAAGTTTPTTPAGAASIGASPDAAKMVGTPAQKQAAVQQTEKEQTLEGVNRLSQPRQQATQQETAATNLSNTFSKLGSMGTRVQALVDQKLQSVSQAGNAQATVKDSGLAGALGIDPSQVAAQTSDPNSPLNLAKAALQVLSQTPTGLEAEKALQTLANLGIQHETARGLLDTGASAIGTAVAAVTPDTLKASDLDVSQLGFANLAEMAATLGVPEETLANANVATIQQMARDAQQRELAKVDTLKAQLRNTPVGSAQHKILMQQLADMGQVGVTGAEAQAQEAVQKLNTADQVTVGDTTMSVEDMLKDDNLSNLISQYVQADPATRDKILPADKFGDLRAWVDSNQQALGVLANDLQATSKAFGTVQAQWDDLATTSGVPLTDELMATIVPGWNRDTVVTSEDLQAAKDTLANSSIGQVATSPGGKEILSKINEDNVHQLKDLSKDQIVAAHDNGKLAGQYEYQKLLGLDGPIDFVTDPAVQEKIATLKPIVDLMRTNGVSNTWLNDKNFLNLSPDKMRFLAENPGQYEDFKQYNDFKTKVAGAKTTADVLSLMFGGPVTDKEISGLNTEYGNLKQWVMLGVPGAAEKLKQFEDVLDANKDGKIDEGDSQSLMDRIKSGMETGGDLQAIFDGQDFNTLFKRTDDSLLTDRFSSKDNTLVSLKEMLANDGKITKDELEKFDDKTLADIVSGNYGDFSKVPGMMDMAKGLMSGKQAAALQQDLNLVTKALANDNVAIDVAAGTITPKTSNVMSLIQTYESVLNTDFSKLSPAAQEKMKLLMPTIKSKLDEARRTKADLDKLQDVSNRAGGFMSPKPSGWSDRDWVTSKWNQMDTKQQTAFTDAMKSAGVLAKVIPDANKMSSSQILTILKNMPASVMYQLTKGVLDYNHQQRVKYGLN